jgi:DNA uptake protein ComE-like DNA-binding protein
MERRRDEGESFRNIAELKKNKGRGGGSKEQINGL